MNQTARQVHPIALICQSMAWSVYMVGSLLGLVMKVSRHRREGTLLITTRRYLLGRIGLTSSAFSTAPRRLRDYVGSSAVAFLVALMSAPIAAGLAAVFYVSDLLTSQYRRHSGKQLRESTQVSSVELIVLTWNGADLLRKCLPSVVEAARNCPIPATVLVVDNGSVDDTIPLLNLSFPTVRVLKLSENLGFVLGNNQGVKASSADVVLLLNNDMLVDKDFVGPLIEALSDPNTFAATSQIMMRDGVRREETGATTGWFRRGRFQAAHAPIDAFDGGGATPVLYAGGGSMAVRREQFLAMGGFNPLFRPIYWEDVDLSYRALKSGLRVLLVPRSKVLHLHRSTMSRFPMAQVQRIVRRNEYLFIWSNIHDYRWMFFHFILIPVNLALESRSVGPAVAVGALLMALVRLPEVLVSRTRASRVAVAPDRAVIGSVTGLAMAAQAGW